MDREDYLVVCTWDGGVGGTRPRRPFGSASSVWSRLRPSLLTDAPRSSAAAARNESGRWITPPALSLVPAQSSGWGTRVRLYLTERHIGLGPNFT